MDKASRDATRRIIKVAVISVGTFVAISLASALILAGLGWSFFVVNGSSMEPTLSHGDSVILKRSKGVNHGDVAFFQRPDNWKDYTFDGTLVKRIVAAPGDKISFDGQVLFLNEKTLYELPDTYQCSFKGKYEHILRDKELFLMGDNRENSLDSLRIMCDGHPDDSYVAPKYMKNYGEIVKVF